MILNKRLAIWVDFECSSSFPCPECGRQSKAHHTESKTRWHLNFFQYAAYLAGREPQCSWMKMGYLLAGKLQFAIPTCFSEELEKAPPLYGCGCYLSGH